MNRTRFQLLVVGIAAWVALAGLVSCVSTDDAPARGRVEHPAQMPVTPAPSEHPSSLADADEPSSGFQRSPIDKAIAEDYPPRPWSKNVPTRSCTNDGECGDGFCNRGRCAAIWTWGARYGQRCDTNVWCGTLPCIDGRCRSCISDAECTWDPEVQDPECTPDPYVPGYHECGGVEGGGAGRSRSRGPLPQSPEQ
jgi:hypothetical protein